LSGNDKIIQLPSVEKRLEQLKEKQLAEFFSSILTRALTKEGGLEFKDHIDETVVPFMVKKFMIYNEEIKTLGGDKALRRLVSSLMHKIARLQIELLLCSQGG